MFTASYGPGRHSGFGDVPGFPAPSNVTNKFEALTAFNARTVNTGSVPEITKITMDFEGDPAPQLYTGKQRGQQGDPMLVVNKPELNYVSGQMRPKQAVALSVGIANRILRNTPDVIDRCSSDFKGTGQFKEINDIVSIFSFAGLLLHLKGDATGSDNGKQAYSHFMRQRQAAIQIKGNVVQAPNLWISNSTPQCGDYGYFVLAKVIPHPDAVAQLVAKMEAAINHPGQADPYPAGDKFSQTSANKSFREAILRGGKFDPVWQWMPVLVRQCRIGKIRAHLEKVFASDPGAEFAFFRLVQFRELIPVRSDHVPVSAIHCAMGYFDDTDVGKDRVYGVVPRAEVFICTDFDDIDSCPDAQASIRQPQQQPPAQDARRPPGQMSAPAVEQKERARVGDDLSQREIEAMIRPNNYTPVPVRMSSVPADYSDTLNIYMRQLQYSRFDEANGPALAWFPIDVPNAQNTQQSIADAQGLGVVPILAYKVSAVLNPATGEVVDYKPSRTQISGFLPGKGNGVVIAYVWSPLSFEIDRDQLRAACQSLVQR